MKRFVYLAVGAAVLCTAAFFLHIRHQRGQRSGCILNIRNVQQAVRSHHGMRGLSVGDPIDWETLFILPGAFLPEPVCPAGGTYTFARFHPEIGILACTCSLSQSEGHEPENHEDW